MLLYKIKLREMKAKHAFLDGTISLDFESIKMYSSTLKMHCKYSFKLVCLEAIKLVSN